MMIMLLLLDYSVHRNKGYHTTRYDDDDNDDDNDDDERQTNDG